MNGVIDLILPPVLLEQSHKVDDFDCGRTQLNIFLKKYALTNNRNGSARTYVATRNNIVLGYYSLTFGSVFYDDAPLRIIKGLPKHPIPIMLLARLAVDEREQGKGLGKGLLKDALVRTLQAADIGGLRAITVYAKDDNARKFYEKFGFESSPINEFHLFLLMKDFRHSWRAGD